MAAITTQPTTQASAYRPLLFQVISTPSPAAQPVERMQIEVWDAAQSALAATFFRDPVSQTGSTNITSFFEFDAADFVRSKIAPFPDVTAGVFLLPSKFKKYSTDNLFRFYCKFRFFKRNTSNLLVDMGEEEQSATITAFNTIYQHRDAHSLAQFTAGTGRRILGDYPATTPISINECHTLSFIASDNIDVARFRFTQTNGVQDFALLDISIALPPLTIINERMIHSVGVGGRNLAATTALEWLVNEFYPDETILDYTVDFGAIVSDVYVAKTEAVKFVLQPVCGGLRLHWLNHRGGPDSHTFDAERRTLFAAKSDATRRPLGWQNAFVPIDRQGRGTSKAAIQSNEFWEVESRILDPQQAAYVAHALESAECYAEFPGEAALLPVIISDAKAATDNTTSIGEVITFTVTPANERITHTI